MNNHNNNNNILNPPPLFSGKKKELDGFLARVELIFRNKPAVYDNDRICVDFVISYLTGNPLDWASNLLKTDDPILDSYEGFVDTEINIRLENLHIRENMAEANVAQRKKRVNKPPIFSGVRKELKGFLTIVDLNFEDEPEDFPDDRSKIRFIMSYLSGDSLDWASNLKKNNDPLIEDVEDFKKELTSNYGDPEVDEIVANGKLDYIRQKKYGHAFEYINEFKTISKNSDFNESAKIYMFLKGLHYKMGEQLAVVNPNPKSLTKLFTDVLQIENLSKRNNLAEFYFNQQRIRNYQSNSNKRVNSQNVDPMDVDLFKIKQHTRFLRYTPMDNQKFYLDNKRDLSEEKKKGLCFLCRQPGHLQFNCPNRKRPKSVKLANKLKKTLKVRLLRKSEELE